MKRLDPNLRDALVELMRLGYDRLLTTMVVRTQETRPQLAAPATDLRALVAAEIAAQLAARETPPAPHIPALAAPPSHITAAPRTDGMPALHELKAPTIARERLRVVFARYPDGSLTARQVTWALEQEGVVGINARHLGVQLARLAREGFLAAVGRDLFTLSADQ